MAKKIKNIHDKLFIDTFSEIEHAKAFLHAALPAELRDRIDFQKMELDKVRYVSTFFEDSFADLIVRSCFYGDNGIAREMDIYLILEHKSKAEFRTLVQILTYMVVMWQKDIAASRPLRVIIPLVFYHGKEEWNIPREFADAFVVPDDIRQYMTNFKYIFFDTREWDPETETDELLCKCVEAFSTMMSFKYYYARGIDSVLKVIAYLSENNVFGNNELTLSQLAYITNNKDITPEELDQKLREIDIDGGEVMPSLVQRLEERGEKRGVKKGRKIGYEEAQRETALEMLKNGFELRVISNIVKIPLIELKKLASTLR